MAAAPRPDMVGESFEAFLNLPDRRRDRVLQRKGLKVFRFTGQEIYRDARACAVEILAELLPVHSAAVGT